MLFSILIIISSSTWIYTFVTSTVSTAEPTIFIASWTICLICWSSSHILNRLTASLILRWRSLHYRLKLWWNWLVSWRRTLIHMVIRRCSHFRMIWYLSMQIWRMLHFHWWSHILFNTAMISNKSWSWTIKNWWTYQIVTWVGHNLLLFLYFFVF